MREDGHNPQREYLLQRIRGRKRPASAQSAGSDGPLSNELSFGQERLWFIEQMQPDTALFNEAFLLEIDGELDRERLASAFRAVIERHEALRTSFEAPGGLPRQVVASEIAFELTVIDRLGGLPRNERAAALEQQVAELARQPFRLDAAPLLRAALFELSKTEHALLVVNHHIVSDAISRAIIAADLAAAYASTAPPEPQAPPYRVFSTRQRRAVDSPAFRHSLAYWRSLLLDFKPVDILLDRPRPPLEDPSGARVELQMAAALRRSVEEKARSLRVTPFAVYMAAFALLLRRLSERADLVIGCPADGRLSPEDDGLVGFCANVLPLRVSAADDLTVDDFIRAVRDQATAGLQHAHIPFEKIVEALNPPRDLSRAPILQVMLSYYPPPEAPQFGPHTSLRFRNLDLGIARFDLTLEIVPSGEDLWCALEFRTSLYNRDSMSTLLQRFGGVLERLCAASDQRLAELDIVGDIERQTALALWNNTASSRNPSETVATRFARQVLEKPDAPAVSCGPQRQTFAALADRANAVAAALLRLGAVKGDRVCVCMERSVDSVSAILGVLQAQCVYVPVDPDVPAERIQFVLEDAECIVAIGSAATQGKLSLAGARNILSLPLAKSGSSDNLTERSQDISLRPEDPAYLIYTSGSTGGPKGVLVSHGNLAAFLHAMDQLLGAADGVWAAATSVAFDISILELIWTVSAGMAVDISPDGPLGWKQQLQPHRLGGQIRAATRPVGFSLFFFSADVDADPGDRYRLLLESARFADAAGFDAIWTPERHFHPFGGLYPNPAVLGAALARETKRIAIRAGSVVAPLHHPVRIAEEWSVVDNLSGGRVGIAFAAGWHVGDFVLRPEAYDDRYAAMQRSIDVVRALWSGRDVEYADGQGAATKVRLFPPPVQQELPIWVTATRSPQTFETAGDNGAGILTHLVGQTFEELAQKLTFYRAARARAGYAEPGHASLMLHAFVDDDSSKARARARDPMKAYLASSLDLVRTLAAALGYQSEIEKLLPLDVEAILDLACDRHLQGSSLIGSISDCMQVVERAVAAGVQEIACLVDFGLPTADVLAGLKRLAALRDAALARAGAVEVQSSEAGAVRRVTHYQVTPTVLRSILDEPGGISVISEIEVLLVGGEALPADLAARVASLPVRVINMYGPTEASVWATAEQLGKVDGNPSIGRPLNGMRTYVLDDQGRLLGPGLPGMLWIGGDGVALGYWKRSDLTAEAFQRDPFSPDPSARMYRTGDRATWLPDGRLRFLGRTDDQVKMRGARVELAEVEAIARLHPDVKDCAAKVHLTVAGDTRLTLYLVYRLGDAPPVESLRQHFANCAPAYLIPNRFVSIDRIPTTVSGKVDRAALSEPPSAELVVDAVDQSASAETIAAVTEIWSRELDLKTDHPQQTFFEAGGHSLLAARFITRCREVFGLQIGLSGFFRDPTIGGLSRMIDTARVARDGADPARSEAAQ